MIYKASKNTTLPVDIRIDARTFLSVATRILSPEASAAAKLTFPT